MKNKLITALRIAANKIESGEFTYEWRQQSACNCGSVVCALKGISRNDLDVALTPLLAGFECASKTWKAMVGNYCPITGIPTIELFKELQDAGLTPKDIIELEYLSNPKVTARLQFYATKKNTFLKRLFGAPKEEQVPTGIKYGNSKHAVSYMREWANILEEDQRDDMAIPASCELAEEVQANHQQ